MYKFIIAIIVSIAVMASPVQAEQRKATATDVVIACERYASSYKLFALLKQNGTSLARAANMLLEDQDNLPEGFTINILLRIGAEYYDTDIAHSTVTPQQVYDWAFESCFTEQTKKHLNYPSHS